MEIIRNAGELGSRGRKTCLCIGFFDGVHLGHQQIIRQTITDARQHEALALVVTFDRHPNCVVAPERVPPLIYSLPQKLRALESLGPDALLLLKFEKSLSLQSGEEFIRGLKRSLGQLSSVCVGANFVFGAKRTGNVELLKHLGHELNFTVHALQAVALGGRPVSSTRIREKIKMGRLDAVGQMLGRAYSLAGNVVEGDRLGTQLGFPTANLDTVGLVLPPGGVYAAQARTEDKVYRAVLNIGVRPTVKPMGAPIRFEAHLLGFAGELYGRELEVTPLERLRDEMKFGSVEELRAQIARDVRLAESRFAQ